MSIAHLTKKADFLALIADMNAPRLTRNNIQVYVFDEKPSNNEVQFPTMIYCASNFREESYIAAQNKLCKFRDWMNEAKNG